MLRLSTLFLALLATLLFTTAACAEPNLSEGKWEITTQMEMPGMPMAIPPVKYTHCMTKKDVVPQQPEKNQDCKMISTDIQGDTVYWVMECKSGKDTMRSNGHVTYKKDRFDGAINATMSGSENMTMQSKISGRYLGPCK